MARAFVIGMGEVGRRLAAALDAAGGCVLAVTRDAGWSAATAPDDPAPRIVAVREEQLAGVLERLGGLPRGRLVLVQNGFLEAVHGELSPVTRGLIWFTSKGEFFRELRPSRFHGPLAAAVADALTAGGLAAEVEPDPRAFAREMVIKGIWNAVVGLPLAVHGVDLATYLERHVDELEALTEEGARAAGAAYGVEVSGRDALGAILETTSALGWVRGGAKALAWRNGAIAAFGRRHGVSTPTHDALLRAAGHDPDSGRAPG